MPHSVHCERKLLWTWIRSIQVTLLQKHIQVDMTTRPMDPYFVLLGAHIPGQNDARSALLTVTGCAPLVEGQHRVPPSGEMSHIKVPDWTKNPLDQVNGVNTQISKRIRPLCVERGRSSARICGIVGSAEIGK